MTPPALQLQINQQIADTRAQAILAYVASVEAKEKPQTTKKP